MIGGRGAPSQDADSLDLNSAITTMKRLAIPVERRVRLFLADGSLGADSHALPGATLEALNLPPPSDIGPFKRAAFAVYDWVVTHLPPRRRGPPLPVPEKPTAENFPLATDALAGRTGSAIFESPDGGRVVLVALPLQSVRRVQGALLIVAPADDVDRSVRDVRFALVLAFAAALFITVLLSLYLAGTITRPVRRLADAADAVRAGRGQKAPIPDFTNRHDEIGTLSTSLAAMTDALWSRMDAIENFVADVAHEIKNPLTSVRSAVETVRRVDDDAQRRKLLDIIAADVTRLDRLLSEITDASRIDTELARTTPEPVDLAEMLRTLVALHEAQATTPKAVRLHLETRGDCRTLAVADRMAQVFSNLVDNAVSFSPAGGEVEIALRRLNGMIEASVTDSGPGVPKDMQERVFERFYTDRPADAAFGTHSGLGLAISRQIVLSHGGTIACENRHDATGDIAGARFIVRLPAAADGQKG